MRVFIAGSGEAFGFTGDEPADEVTPFNPQSPYAGAKASAQLIASAYRVAYSLHVSTGILFPHESPLRDERFVTQKIARAASRIAKGEKERLRLGNLSIERDWGWAPEYVEAMWLMLQQNAPDDFVIASGRSIALEQFVSLAFDAVGLDWRKHVDVDPSLFRRADPLKCRANPSKAARVLAWKAKTSVENVIRHMVTNAAGQ
jgi:GDPmannose 4,6-dehydratase